jgi:hypothetical protein
VPRFTKAAIEELFTYHAPKAGQPERYQRIRDKAKELALVIAENTPEGADQSAAIRHLREAVFTANAAIALETGAV